MDQLTSYADSRNTGWCVYCGGGIEARDHVPSKVFLDEPYPANLSVVPACQKCNGGFSLDEEYVACLVECTLAGSAKASKVRREKITQILEKKPSLAAMLHRARHEIDDQVFFEADNARVRNVVLKLARGHAAFELNETPFDDPLEVGFAPLVSMSQEARAAFESLPEGFGLWPEVGSRYMQRLLRPNPAPWIVAQQDRYRYLVSFDSGLRVRGVIGEYLGFEVVWD